MDTLKHVIATIFAARVYVSKHIDSFEKRRKELGVTTEFNYPNMQKLLAENHELDMTLK